MRGTAIRVLLTSFFLISSAILINAQDPTPEPPAGPGPGGARPGGTPNTDPQPYDRVITKDAKSKDGIFKVHQIKDKFFYEIPKAELDKDFVWVSQIAKTTLGVGYGGQALNRRVVRWERNENRIFLRNVNYSVVADPNLPISEAVQNSNNGSIIMAFPVAAWGPNEAAVIDVSRLFSTDVFEFSARQRLNATALDATRSYIEKISSFPTNIEARSSMTYTRQAPPAGAGGGGPGAGQAQQGMPPGSATVVLHHSMVKLPNNPMMPRLFDERVGYFSVNTMDFGRPEHRAQTRTFITRWRLEKKDPNAAVSDPVKPIVYYIDRATPAWLVSYTKRGVEKWQKAFLAAGFSNAIIAKPQPSKAEDPNFDPEDARYSVIRWLPSTIENASGPHINDPRTGEILESDIQMYHNIMNLQRSWYFLQAGAVDSRVHKLPIPQELMGELVEYVVAHEVGHTLGFQHNMKASSMYPQEKVRDKEWVKKMGHTPTLMDYSRFNYVAQPEDGIAMADLIPGIGPYDEFATMWGYKPIAGARTSDAERSTLDDWARQQDASPWLRFSTDGSAGSDPGELTEAVGDADAVKSSALGQKNLQRIAKILPTAATTQKGDNYDDLTELYGRMLGQWTLEMNHVAAIVGGYNSQQKHIGQTGARFNLIPRARQAEAVAFLSDNAFVSPTWQIDKDILRKIEPIGALNRIRNSQNGILNNLLSSARFARLVEQSTLDGVAAYDPADFLADVRKGVWTELSAPKVTIDAYRRNLQRAYLDIANSKLNAPAAAAPQGLPPGLGALFVSSGDERGFYRSELRALSAAANTALARSSDRATRAHLESVRDQIGRILNPETGGARTAAIAINEEAMRLLDLYLNPTSCWPDYVIRP
jgi:hypothetical protein